VVWVIIGHRARSERVPDGLSVERECTSCGEVATFYEREAVKSFRLYFVDVFDYDRQRVMACGACGTLYATDELGRPSAATAGGWRDALSSAASQVSSAARKAGQAIAPTLEQAGENARELFDEAREGIAPMARRASEEVGDAFRRLRIEDDGVRDLDAEDDEPARPKNENPREKAEWELETDPEKRAVLKRFAELEKKLSDADE